MQCTKCGKEMTNENGMSIIGAMFEVNFEAQPELREFAQQQLGKYELDKPYPFCYECILDGLMGRGNV